VDIARIDFPKDMPYTALSIRPYTSYLRHGRPGAKPSRRRGPSAGLRPNDIEKAMPEISLIVIGFASALACIGDLVTSRAMLAAFASAARIG
jgi:hypothetical protein